MEEKIKIENYTETEPHPEIKRAASEAAEMAKKEQLPAQEAIKRTLAPSIEKAKMSVSTTPVAPTDNLSAEVDALVQAAVSEGITKAMDRAAKKGAFFLDAFHDKLAEKIQKEFSNP